MPPYAEDSVQKYLIFEEENLVSKSVNWKTVVRNTQRNEAKGALRGWREYAYFIYSALLFLQ